MWHLFLTGREKPFVLLAYTSTLFANHAPIRASPTRTLTRGIHNRKRKVLLPRAARKVQQKVRIRERFHVSLPLTPWLRPPWQAFDGASPQRDSRRRCRSVSYTSIYQEDNRPMQKNNNNLKKVCALARCLTTTVPHSYTPGTWYPDFVFSDSYPCCFFYHVYAGTAAVGSTATYAYMWHCKVCTARC